MAKKMTTLGYRTILRIALGCSVFFLTGCTRNYDGFFDVLNGVLAWSRQDWPVSTSSFLEAVEKSRSSGDPLPGEYAVYGLASIYLAQDEYDSALLRLAEIGDASTPELRAGVWYQAGIIAYRKGHFDEALAHFRKSLENDPSSLDAKINLELSRLSLAESRSDMASGNQGIQENNVDGQESETVFNLIRKKEQDRWKNQEEDAVQAGVEDY